MSNKLKDVVIPFDIPGLEEEAKPDFLSAPFPCPYESGFIKTETGRANELFQVLDSLPKDEKIAEHKATRTQPDVPTWKRVSGRLVLTFFDGTSEAAKSYVNRFGDCGSFVYPWEQAPAELREAREALRERLGFKFSLVYMNHYGDGHVPISPHADREDVGTLFPIATISLGAERPWTTYLRDHSRPWPKHVSCYGAKGGWPIVVESRADRIAQHGSLLIMQPGFQETHIHAVLGVGKGCGPRISLTFRNPMDAVTNVVSKYKGNYDIYVGRGSAWGNPFSSDDGSKAQYIVKPQEVMPRFREWFKNRVNNEDGFARKIITELYGKTLGCFCEGDKPCHARIMASWADLLFLKAQEFKENPGAAKAWLKGAPYKEKENRELKTETCDRGA